MCYNKTLVITNRDMSLVWEDHLSLDDHSSCWDVGKVWGMTGVNCIARSFRGNCGPEA